MLRDAGVAALADAPSLMPALLVVIDEFGELLVARPEMLDVLGSIGRLGRSLGVHLLLSSQRLEEGRLRGLDSHLRYRLCLRTYSAAESTIVLGVADAAHLPARPGVGFLQVDGTRTRVDVAYASAAVIGASRRSRVRAFGAMVAEPVLRPATTGEGSELDVLIGRLATSAPPARQVWQPPLPEQVPTVEHRGGPLTITLGLVDLPRQQTVDAWSLDLTDPLVGQVAVVGAARSGRTAFLRATANGVGDGVRVVVVDPSGGLADVPCWAYAGSLDAADAVLRSISAPQATPVLLLVDDVDRLTAGPFDEADLMARLAAITAAGQRSGVHVVVTAPRWADLRAGLRDAVTTRLELRLNDPADSLAVRGAQARLRRAPAGRVVLPDGTHAQVVAPAAPRRATLDQGRRLELPLRVVVTEPARRAGALVLGPAEPDLAPWQLPPTGHVVVVGERGSGRSTLLGRIAAAWLDGQGPERALTLVDPRRSQVDLAAAARSWVCTSTDAAAAVVELAGILAGRAWRPGTDPRQRWWSGPEHLLVVDDADLVSGYAPLSPLTELLAHADDLGLRVVVARRCAGWQRSAFDPVLTSLRENGATYVLLPGSPAEGAIVNGLRCVPGPVGRATVVDPDGRVATVQLALTGGAAAAATPADHAPAPADLAAARARRAS